MASKNSLAYKEMEFIAVYGSLCQGFFNFNKYLQGRIAQVAQGRIKGRLYHMPLRGYPALLPGEDDVYCEIMGLQGDTAQIIKDLDELENATQHLHPYNEYHRCNMPVVNLETGKILSLPVYMFNMQHPRAKVEPMVYIAHGNWPKYMRENAMLDS